MVASTVVGLRDRAIIAVVTYIFAPVGLGVLRECLLDRDVRKVVTVGRNATGQRHDKLREPVHADLFDLSRIEAELTGFDACFFCLGVTSAGMTEEAYRRLTYDLTLAVANTLARLNPAMTFLSVSGQGTDGSEHGSLMWARVKGATENALARLPFKAAYAFRPGVIQPLDGIRSKTKLYQAGYTPLAPLLPLWRSTDIRSMSSKAATSTASANPAPHILRPRPPAARRIRQIPAPRRCLPPQ